MRPVSIPSYIADLRSSRHTNAERIAFIKRGYAALLKGNPSVSIVIPAYNEAETILPTLHSICANVTTLDVEIIVVNNNSKDNTRQLVTASGVTCIDEMRQGITAARNAGLAAASGTYILNADADTIYPLGWIDAMVAPLVNGGDISVTYGRYAFIPTGVTNRFTYFFYESIVDLMRLYKKTFKEEAVNVGGFNSCFRKAQGLQVDGFAHPVGANEDGYLALKLRNKGFGKLLEVSGNKNLAWTTDRRIQIDGGLLKGILKRIKRVFFNRGELHPGLGQSE